MAYTKETTLLERAGRMNELFVDAFKENLTAGDTLEPTSFIMCAGKRVKNVHLEVQEVEGAAATVSVGTAASPTLFLNAVDVNTVAQYISADADATLFSADTQLVVTIDSNMSNGKFVVKVLYDDFTSAEVLFRQDVSN